MLVRFILIMIFASTLSAPAFALRCGSDLVVKGDSQSRVLKKCGEPEASFNRTIVRTAGVHTSNRRYAPHAGAFNEVAIEIHIEEWEYSFGPRRFGRRIVFEGGRVVDIELMGYDN